MMMMMAGVGEFLTATVRQHNGARSMVALINVHVFDRNEEFDLRSHEDRPRNVGVAGLSWEFDLWGIGENVGRRFGFAVESVILKQINNVLITVGTAVQAEAWRRNSKSEEIELENYFQGRK